LSQIARFTPGTRNNIKAQLALRDDELRTAKVRLNEQQVKLDQWMSYCVDLETQYQAALQQLKTQHKSSLQHREEHIASLADQLARLKQENSALLSSISKANRAQGPVNPETYYVDQFDSLNHLIQSSVAGMYKWSCNTEISSDAISQVHNLLDSIDPCGKWENYLANDSESDFH